MKAITLTQPWATLVEFGEKRLETRSWSTNHRGRLAIHAAVKYPPVCRQVAATEPFVSALRRHARTPNALTQGKIVAVVDLIDVQRIDTRDDITFLLDRYGAGPHEFDFGDFARGRFVWVLRNVARLSVPIVARTSAFAAVKSARDLRLIGQYRGKEFDRAARFHLLNDAAQYRRQGF
jgi:hypothetical protein